MGSRSIETITDGKEKLEAVISLLGKGKPDPEIMRQACEEMDRMREETRRRIGTVDVAVDLIRDARK